MTFLARLCGATRFVKPQPGQSQFLYSWMAGDDTTGFTRASSAEYVDRSGFVQAAATDAPRLALDPTGEVGLLLEPAQTFEWPQTADFTSTAGWSNAYLTVVSSSVVGPRGAAVQKLTPTTATVNAHRTARTTPGATDDTPQTLIAELRDAGYRYVSFTPLTKDGAAYVSVVDVATGAIVSKATPHTIHVLPLADAFYRFWVTANSKHGAFAMDWRVAVSDSPVVGQLMAGDGTKGVYCSLLQVATDCDYATSPLSASGSAPTRAAESWTAAGAVAAGSVGKTGTIYEKYYDQLTGEVVEQVRVVTLTADYEYQPNRYYRAVKIALGVRTLSEMQGDVSLPPAPVATSVTVTPTIASLTAGQTMQLSAAVKDQNGNAMAGETVTWGTSDAGVATVTTAGAVTAVAAGTATITATCDSNGALAATCSLTVNAASGAGFDYDSYPHSTTGLLFAYTDFRTSYFANTTAGNAQRETERLFIAAHVDKGLSAGEPSAGYPVGFVHQPYILTSFVACCVHDTDNWNNGRSKTNKIFEDWCTANGKDPEDGYLHWDAASTPYKATITSIDSTGKVTLKYDFVTYTGGALANGDTVVIAGCTPDALNGTWTVSGVGVTGGGLDANGDLTRAQTVFTIPHTGDTAVTKGTASLPVRSEKTRRNRLIFDVPSFPPPRWCINHASPTRIAFEQYRLTQMLAGAYGIGFSPEGFYVDELAENNIGKVAGKLCREYTAGSADQFYADIGSFYDAVGGSVRATYPWIQELGTASYVSALTVSMIEGSLCSQLEQLGNTHTRFEWAPGTQRFEFVRSLLRLGAHLEFATPYTPQDTIDGGQKPGNYANDPVPAGVKAAANVRMYASVLCVALLMQLTDQPQRLALNVWNGAWSPEDPNAGLNNRWCKLFEVDLGAPIEEPARVVTGKKDTAGQGVTISARNYERGLVAYRRIDVDWAVPTVDYAATYTYTPPASSGPGGLWARVKSDGTLDVPASTFDLASDEGLILVPAAGTGGSGAGTAYHVTTSGTSGGDGTSGSPWSLSYALGGAGGAIQPGDTVEVAAGTYTGNFTSTLAGTKDSPIVVKAASGARATIDGTIVCAESGAYTWFWGLEVMRSAVDANIIGVNSFATGNKFIHCVIHDHPSNGLGMWSEGPDQEAYGNLIYSNGYSGQDPTHSAHGIYTQNDTGTKYIKHNIIFDQYGYGIHAYGSELVHVDDYLIEENVLVNNGRGNAVSQSGGMNYLVENGNPIVGMTFRGNLGYYTLGAGDTAGKFGSVFNADVINDGGRFQDNYMVGLVTMGYWRGLTVTGNTCIQQEDYIVVGKYLYSTQPPLTGTTWDNNTYYSVGTGNQFQTVDSAGVSSGRTFSGWKSYLGIDAASTFTASLPSANKVVVQPSEYEAGRANIVVFNWAAAATVDADVSAVLTIGDSWELLDVNDFYGTPVATGTYAGGSITITLAAKTPPASVSAIGTMPSTGTTFKAYVLRKTS